MSPQRSQTFELTLSTAAAPAWVAARAAADPERMADRPIAPSMSILPVRETRHARGGILSRHVSKGNPSALVNVCICVRFTRLLLDVQTPARDSFVLSSLGSVEVFIFARRRTCFLELVRRRLEPASVGRD